MGESERKLNGARSEKILLNQLIKDSALALMVRRRVNGDNACLAVIWIV
jgi:hypothetical protein